MTDKETERSYKNLIRYYHEVLHHIPETAVDLGKIVRTDSPDIRAVVKELLEEDFVFACQVISHLIVPDDEILQKLNDVLEQDQGDDTVEVAGDKPVRMDDHEAKRLAAAEALARSLPYWIQKRIEREMSARALTQQLHHLPRGGFGGGQSLV